MTIVKTIGYNIMKRVITIIVAFFAMYGSISLAEEPPLTGAGTLNDPITTHSTNDSTVTTNGNMTTTIKQPPPSAISPQFSAGSNSDLCTIGVAGAVQTQILGISAGTTFTEENCIRLKNAKTLYDMGMKVAAVSVMCQDKKVFDAMMHAGTPCPYNGTIGQAAKLGWETHVETTQKELDAMDKPSVEETAIGIGGILMGLLLIF
jgi:hypothetical protein